MELSINDLKQIALNVYDAVLPLIGTKEGAIKFERGAGGDFTMHIDTVAEETVIKSLKKLSIDILLISEEIGEIYIGDEIQARNNENVLIIDPIDGSNNAARGIPYCSVSLAYAIGKNVNDIQKAVVLDLSTKDIYWAVRGEGAYLNERKIKVSELNFSNKCFFELDLPRRNMFTLLNKWQPIIQKFSRVRVMGSSALTLCQVAKGSMDAFIDLKESNRLVDVAAGFLILKEAGGKFFSIDGAEINDSLSIDLKFPFIACNSELEPLIKKELAK